MYAENVATDFIFQGCRFLIIPPFSNREKFAIFEGILKKQGKIGPILAIFDGEKSPWGM